MKLPSCFPVSTKIGNALLSINPAQQSSPDLPVLQFVLPNHWHPSPLQSASLCPRPAPLPAPGLASEVRLFLAAALGGALQSHHQRIAGARYVDVATLSPNQRVYWCHIAVHPNSDVIKANGKLIPTNIHNKTTGSSQLTVHQSQSIRHIQCMKWFSIQSTTCSFLALEGQASQKTSHWGNALPAPLLGAKKGFHFMLKRRLRFGIDRWTQLNCTQTSVSSIDAISLTKLERCPCFSVARGI